MANGPKESERSGDKRYYITDITSVTPDLSYDYRSEKATGEDKKWDGQKIKTKIEINDTFFPVFPLS